MENATDEEEPGPEGGLGGPQAAMGRTSGQTFLGAEACVCTWGQSESRCEQGRKVVRCTPQTGHLEAGGT